VAALHYDVARDELGTEVLGVWLVGSAILGDLTQGSDVDTVTLTSHPVERNEHAGIVRVHEVVHQTFPGVRHDTTFLSLAALGLPPPAHLVTPHSVDGVLHLGKPSGEVHAVTWLTLPHALPVAGGIRPREVHIHADQGAAQEYARANLQDYWARVAAETRVQLRGRDGTEPLRGGQVVVWLTLGAARLTAFLAGARAQGPVPSKSEAGRWVARRVPQHAALARRAMRARAGYPEAFTVGDARQATDLVMLLVHGHG
jgi:hypothetical protein